MAEGEKEKRTSVSLLVPIQGNPRRGRGMWRMGSRPKMRRDGTNTDRRKMVKRQRAKTDRGGRDDTDREEDKLRERLLEKGAKESK